MLFNSFEFLLFLPCVFAGYWLLGRWLRLQNLFVIAVSYLFYGWWDWRFLLLIAFTSAWSYLVGLIELRRWEARPSRLLLTVSLVVNLGILGYFKYCNFFVDSFLKAIMDVPEMKVVLPVGISFYTFQALSYTVDVYRRQFRPVKDPIAFFAFISFFPQLVAGPIERAVNLLPQFVRRREFSYDEAVDGCRRMLWGFFKKCVVADNCASVADGLLNGSSNGLGVWLGVFLFSIQIYGDFSGYSDIAIGCARLFGVKLMRNFAFPYFSRDIAEFWRRWHISLTTWFRDYLYIPLGGSRCSTLKCVRNTFVIFLVSGLWHGANWTFVLWGLYHAVLFLPLLLRGSNRRNLDDVAASRWLPSLGELRGMLAAFVLAVIGWAIFRAPSVGEAFRWFALMFDPRSFSVLHGLPRELPVALVAIAVMTVVEWFARHREHALSLLPSSTIIRWPIYFALFWVVLFYCPGTQTFIYFQF